MRKLYLLLLGVLLFVTSAWAQRTVTGKVTDDKGNPIPNVSVFVKGTNAGTTTKDDGTYTLVLPANAKTLVFSSVGMGTREIGITSESTISVALSPVDKSMDEAIEW